MSARTRIATFLLLLVVIAGGGALLGATIDPSTSTAESGHAAMADGESGHAAMSDESGGHEGMAEESGEAETAAAGEHGAGHGGAADATPQGLQVAADGFQLALDRTRWARTGPATLAFRILGPDGKPVTDFEVEHAKRLHLIVVRRDTKNFQHVHPTMAADGTWRTHVRFPSAGTYRVFADFSTGGTRRTLATDAHVGGRFTPRPLPAPRTTARTAGGLTVTLDAPPAHAGEEDTIAFTVRDGKQTIPDARLGTYLGAKGHLVALREGDLAYLHVHPDGDRLSFMGTFPTAGNYRLWLQFRYRDRIETAAFTLAVAR